MDPKEARSDRTGTRHRARVRPRRRSALVLLPLAALILVATACGGSSSSSSSNSSNGQGSSKAPLIVGNVESLTGPLASTDGQLLPGIEAWADWTNAHGGINGHQVDLISLDDGGSAATSVANVRRLILQDHIDVLLDGTPVDSSWATVVQEYKVPVIADLFNSTPNSYYFSPGTPLIPTGNEGAFKAAKQEGGSRLAFLYCTEVSACSQAVPVAQSAAKTYGLTFAYATGISASAPNYTAQCLAVKKAQADIINVYDAAEVQLNVATSCAAIGYSFRILSSDLNFDNSWLANSAVNGAISEVPVFPFSDDSTSATQEYHQAMSKYEPSVVNSQNFGVAQAAGWTAGEEVTVAAELGKAGVNGAPTSAEILNGLFAMHGNTLNGLAPPLTYSHQANENSLINCFFVMAIKNGKFSEPYGLEPQCLSS
jgi:branched-chain amino acid transport system substrate-binding protein